VVPEMARSGARVSAPADSAPNETSGGTHGV
jgi:hypothetical protein